MGSRPSSLRQNCGVRLSSPRLQARNMHNVEHLVNELQLYNLHGQRDHRGDDCTCGNSTGFGTVRTMRANRCPTTGMNTTSSQNCTCVNSTGFCTVWTMGSRKGPANQGREHIARCIVTTNTSLVQATATVLLVHTGHDAEHPEPGAARREHDARCIVTSQTSIVHATATPKTSAELSFWSIPTMAPKKG